VDGHDVGLGEEVGAELQVVVEVERPASLETLAEVRDGYGLLVLAPAPVVLVLVLRQARRPAATAGVVRRRGRWRVCRCRVRVRIVVIVGRHYRLIDKRDVELGESCRLGEAEPSGRCEIGGGRGDDPTGTYGLGRLENKQRVKRSKRGSSRRRIDIMIY
jgi:hypothetical protein